jgi:hypothetical protein
VAVPNHSPHALHSAIPLTQATKIVQHHISLKIIAKYDFVTNTPFINALPASDHRYNIQPKVNINGAVRQMLVAPRHRNKGGDVDFHISHPPPLAAGANSANHHYYRTLRNADSLGNTLIHK